MKPDWRWRAIFLWLPSIAVGGMLAREIRFSANPWPTRPFSQAERLLTEPRILWEYLYHLYVPRIEGRGLFQDDFAVSTDWLAPPTTLLSLLGVAALLLTAVWMRKRGRGGAYVALAVLFFLASHLVESTVVGLELYFEHRNYAAAAFLFLPPAMGIVWVAQHKSRLVGVGCAAGVMVMLCGLTWQRAQLWADTNRLQTYWAVANADSPRAQNHLAVQMFVQGRSNETIEFLSAASARLPQSALLSIQLLLIKHRLGLLTAQDFERTRQALPHQRFDAQALLGMRRLVEALASPQSRQTDREQALQLLDLMQSLPQYTAVPVFNRVAPYLRGLLLLQLGRDDEAAQQLLEAMQLYRETDAALSMVADMAKAGRPCEALQLLAVARTVYAQQADRSLIRSRAIYDKEFERLQSNLQQDAETTQCAKKQARP